MNLTIAQYNQNNPDDAIPARIVKQHSDYATVLTRDNTLIVISDGMYRYSWQWTNYTGWKVVDYR